MPREPMGGEIKADLCVIGAGSAGLSIAAGASQMGASTVLIEGGRMGGDCLNTGCVPSKALLAAAKAAQTMRRADRYGLTAVEPEIDFARVQGHVHGVIAGIAPHDSVERFEGLGVTVLRDYARFVGPDRVQAGTVTVRARRFVVATGSRAALPPIPGLADSAPLTNETLFELTRAPEHLIVIGGGPIGCEMAQAHRRLGSRVTVLERDTLLNREEPALVEVVRRSLIADGIELVEGAAIARVERAGETVGVWIADGAGERRIDGSHLLVAAGRQPVTDGLDLEAAGVAHGPGGVTVDGRLRSTTNKRVFAAGDVAGGPQFTHLAGYHAGIVIRNVLFRVPAKVDLTALPRVTFTDPELAGVGLTEAEAKERHGDRVRVVDWPLEENDRARAEHQTEGAVRVVIDRRGRILGAHIAGAHAGELIQPWILALTRRMKIGAFAALIAPYPTLGEINKRVAGAYYTPTLFGDRTKRLVRFLQRIG